jgi:hypothetical protein
VVDETYIDRLQEYIAAECAAHARRQGETGVNAYARYTERVLSKWGLSGFAPGQISRWMRREVKANLDGKTLERLGLLKGYSDSPEKAGKLAWAWLNGEQELSASITTDKGSHEDLSDIVRQIQYGQYNAGQLRLIAVAAIDKLADQVEEDTERPQPLETALTWLLRGWMAQQGKSLVDLANTVGVSTRRMQQIIDGHPMEWDECRAVASLTRLKPSTLVEWGLCPTATAEVVGNHIQSEC